jgi:hypothetical protein
MPSSLSKAAIGLLIAFVVIICGGVLMGAYFPGVLNGTSGNLAYYPTTGQSVSGNPNVTVDSSGNVSVAGYLVAGSPNPNCTAGTGAGLCAGEGTAPTGLVNVDELWADSTAHALKEIANNGSAFTLAGYDIAQTWTAIQTFTNSDIRLLGSSTGYTTLTSANSGSSNYTLTIPAATDTLDLLGTAQTFTAVKTFTNSDINLLGSSTGYTTFTSGNSSSSNYTLTIPANTGTLGELNLAQTWSAVQTYNNSDINLLGSSTGYTTLTSANSSGTNYTFSFPAANGTPVVNSLGYTEQIMMGGMPSAIASATTMFFPIQGQGTINATEANVEMPFAKAVSTIRNLYCWVSAQQGSSKSDAFTVDRNGSATTSTCTATNAQTCNYTTAVTISSPAAGDQWDIKDVTAGTGSWNNRGGGCSVEFDFVGS